MTQSLPVTSGPQVRISCSPEDQEQAILAYLSEAGFAYRQDIARVLRIGPRQCWPILQRMLAEHQIAKDGQKYILLQKEA